MLESILNEAPSGITLLHLLLCTASSLGAGLVIAAVHTYKNVTSRNFIMTLVLLPVIVQIVIMMVNGNLGTGVAVMGAFSLVRFRSMPGNAREISSVFLAMAVGLANGTGYIGIGLFLVLVTGIVTCIFLTLPDTSGEFLKKDLKITIPENLDYNGIFDTVFSKYTTEAQLLRVKTVNMGSLYELNYAVSLASQACEKEFIDELRCRNGNLTIVCGRRAQGESL